MSCAALVFSVTAAVIMTGGNLMTAQTTLSVHPQVNITITLLNFQSQRTVQLVFYFFTLMARIVRSEWNSDAKDIATG